MTNKIALVLFCLDSMLPGLGVQAAPASQTEADRLKSVFERYVGQPEPGGAPAVTVTPEGSAYRASFDARQLTRALEPFGITVEPATSNLLLTPNDTGTWKVSAEAFPPLVIHFNNQTFAMRSSTYAFEGTFDPRIPAFSASTTRQDGATFDQDSPTLTQQRRIGHVDATQSAEAAEADSARVKSHYSISDLSDAVATRAAPPKDGTETAPAEGSVQFNYKLASGTADLSLDRVRLRSLLDLWAFLVAHPTRDSLTSSQEDLRGLVRAALPLIGALQQSGSAKALALTTQTGPFSIGKLVFSLALSDLSASGKAALGLAVEGLAVPKTDLPPWSLGLIPTAFELKPTLTGFRFDQALKEAVEDFDIKQSFLTPEQREKIGHLAWPGDARLQLASSRITSDLLDLRLEGEASLGAVPTGRATITGTGLDKAIDAVQAAAGTDETAAQVLEELKYARGLGKPGPDGSLVWTIEAAGPGPVTVNGQPLR